MNYKVQIKNKEHSKIMQKWAFQNGFKWFHSGMGILHINKPYLYFENGGILFGENEEGFYKHSNIEIFEPFIIEPQYEIY
jgi:hypothetical protein